MINDYWGKLLRGSVDKYNLHTSPYTFQTYNFSKFFFKF